MKQFLNNISDEYSVITHQRDHTTHKSSNLNRKLGAFSTSLWRLTFPKMREKPELYHPIIQDLEFPFPVETEEDVTFYSSIQLVTPLLSLLKSQYPHLQFHVRTEVTATVEVETDRNEMESGKARTDLILEASRLGSRRKHIVFVLEYKAPRTLSENEWINDLQEGGSGKLTGNAKVVGLQKRKYFCSTNFPIVCAFDGCSLAGIKAKYRDRKTWASYKEMKVEVFFEDRKDQFSRTMLAVMVLGLEHQGLI